MFRTKTKTTKDVMETKISSGIKTTQYFAGTYVIPSLCSSGEGMTAHSVYKIKKHKDDM